MLRKVIFKPFSGNNLLHMNRRNFASKINSAASTMSMKKGISPFDYYLVLDFEATCEQGTLIEPQEIIEFPVLKVNGKTFKTESQFHHYVRPVFNPTLTPFCTNLTGIIQEEINDKQDFTTTFKMFNKWMNDEGLLEGSTSSIFVTCGDWDLNTMLPNQCQTSKIEIPPYFKTWLNIKKVFCDFTGIFPKGLPAILNNLNLKHIGRLHSGIDDCKNIAEALRELHTRGCNLKANSSLFDSNRSNRMLK